MPRTLTNEDELLQALSALPNITVKQVRAALVFTLIGLNPAAYRDSVYGKARN
jgi:hypothetical protein